MTSAPSTAPTDDAAPTRYREIVGLALPAMASGFVWVAYHWINQIWVGRMGGHGSAPVAALSVAVFGTWAFGALSGLAGTGLNALVGRYVGAGRPAAASYVATHGLRFAAAFGALVGLVGIFIAPKLAAWSDVGPEAAAMSTGYLRAFYAAGFAALTQGAADSVFRGHGDTRTPFLVAVATLSTNALLDPILIFGAGPVPALGVTGAGIASAIAATGGAVASVWRLHRRGFLSTVRPPDAELKLVESTPIAPGPLRALDLSVVRRVGRVGVPTSLQGLIFVAIYFMLARIVTKAGGDDAIAGLGAGLRGEQVAYFLGLGFMVAAASLVSRRLGAHRPRDAQRCAVRCSMLASAGCLAWGTLLYVLADALAALFIESGSPAARAHAADFYRIVAPCLMFQAWEHVLEGAFAGAGLTWPPMISSVLLTVIRIPIARWAAFDLGAGVRGIWVVIAVTAALRGVFLAIWFARGTWKTRRV